MTAATERTIWQQWDAQEERRLAKQAIDGAYIQLNNLYLAVERGEVRLSVSVSNNLRSLVCKAYPANDDFMRDYWANEFIKLPRWNDF